MAPPITSVSTCCTRFSSSAILVETLAPPTTAITGRSGSPSALLRCVSSCSIERPAAMGSRCARRLGRGMCAVRGGEGVIDDRCRRASRAVWRSRDRSLLRRHESACFRAAERRRPSASPRPPSRRRRCSLPRTRQACPTRRDSAAATGFSDMDGTTLPFGRSKWESTITRAPLSASSRMVGACRSMRTVSVTTPSFIGTFRSARTSTRLPFT